jgi:hypothetical protein
VLAIVFVFAIKYYCSKTDTSQEDSDMPKGTQKSVFDGAPSSVISKSVLYTYCSTENSLLNPLKSSNNYVPAALTIGTVTFYFVFMFFIWLSQETVIIFLSSVNSLSFVMVKFCIFLVVWTEFLNTI